MLIEQLIVYVLFIYYLVTHMGILKLGELRGYLRL